MLSPGSIFELKIHQNAFAEEKEVKEGREG